MPHRSLQNQLVLVERSLRYHRFLENKLGIKTGETTADGKFTLKAVECLFLWHSTYAADWR